jgi:hypothetical protein
MRTSLSFTTDLPYPSYFSGGGYSRLDDYPFAYVLHEATEKHIDDPLVIPGVRRRPAAIAYSAFFPIRPYPVPSAHIFQHVLSSIRCAY